MATVGASVASGSLYHSTGVEWAIGDVGRGRCLRLHVDDVVADIEPAEYATCSGGKTESRSSDIDDGATSNIQMAHMTFFYLKTWHAVIT